MGNTDQTITVQTTARDLATVLAATIPFAGHPEDGLPVIAAVQLAAGDGMLTASATDRYALGHARQQAIASEPVRFILDVDDARHLRKRIKQTIKASGGKTPVQLDVAPGTKRVLTVTITTYKTMTITFTEVDPSWAPRFDKIFEDSLTKVGATPAAQPVGLSAHVLKPILKVAALNEIGEPLRWSFGDAMQPIRVEMGEWFIAVVMPVRIDERTQPVEYRAPVVTVAEIPAEDDEPVIPTAEQPAVVRQAKQASGDEEASAR